MNEHVKCETCLYNKNCQLLAKHKNVIVEDCTAYKNITDTKELRTNRLSEAYNFLYDFDSYSEYQENLKLVLDTLDFALTQWDSKRESYNHLWDQYCDLLGKNTPKEPLIWENKYYYSPTPNDDWGYECPYCGNQEIDYPEHHCTCGQALKWDNIHI